jgi:hypothetical protein
VALEHPPDAAFVGAELIDDLLVPVVGHASRRLFQLPL